MEQLIGYIQEAGPDGTWKIATEFRHPSWYTDRLLQFAEGNNLSIVLQDIPASATPMDYAVSYTIYLRLHGPDGKYRGGYPDDFLQEYSTYIREWQEDGKTVYVYFNNTMGDGVKNLITLNSLVQQP